MTELAKEISQITVETELKQSYLDYAMSVIVGRALPDVRDGLKPVHRRVLFGMHELNNEWNKPHKKSARVVGDVIGKYHPHGESAVYDTIVRMAQPFTMRYLLVDGQGNFGSVDGDAPAAMRYTEVRMSKVAHALLADLEKETVDFAPNYDGSEFAPVVLPTRVPNLLINGASGIAVGMATNIPPHNLGEVIDACIALIQNPDLTFEELIQLVPGPDFPTAAIINGRAGIIEAYKTGRGRVVVRARSHFETNDDNNKQSIVVTELPYQVNKAKLIERIAELVKEKKLEGITGLRDESDKDGMRIVVELRRGEIAEVILNNLLSQTAMQSVFGINMVALVDGQPRTLTLKAVLEAFIRHRREVITRRTLFELRKARERAHILEGLGIALANIDEMIALIKASPNPASAKEQLLAKTWHAGMVSGLLRDAGGENISRFEGIPAELGLHGETYRLSPEQAQAILELRLHRLTGLEQDKIFDEFRKLIAEIQELISILENPIKLLQLMQQELLQIKADFSDARRTEIQHDAYDLTMEDLITDEKLIVTLSREGYVKSQPATTYQAQRRGGRGKAATAVKEEDVVQCMLVANAHDTLLAFSSRGKVYWLKAYQLPQAGRNSRGKPIVNLLSLETDERITAILPIEEFTDNQFIFMATAEGTVKKVPLSQFSRPRPSGLIALGLSEGDELIGAELTNGSAEVMMFSDAGKVIRFAETSVRAMGRSAQGVRGMRVEDGQRIISLITVSGDGDILTATERGYGKRTAIDEYRAIGRGGKGVVSIQVSARNGKVVAALQVIKTDEVLLISDRGTAVRTRVDEISLVGRNTQGVKLINLAEEESLVAVEKIAEEPLSDGTVITETDQSQNSDTE